MPKGVYRKIECPDCKMQLSANVFNRHVTRSCGGKSRYKVKGRVAWNKGLTAKTDTRLAESGKKISLTTTGKEQHQNWSLASRQRASVAQSERLLRTYADGSREQSGGYCKWFEVDGIKVQGTWELRTAKILSSWKLNGIIKNWSRCKHRIEYFIDEKQHTYTPDFSIERLDGTEYILEIKGRQSLVDDIKWKAVSASFDFVVWRLQDIKNNEKG